MTRFHYYEELMSIAYPNSFKQARRGKVPKHVIVDDEKSFKRLGNYLQEDLIKSLEQQIRDKKRSLPDKDNDDYIIKEKR